MVAPAWSRRAVRELGFLLVVLRLGLSIAKAADLRFQQEPTPPSLEVVDVPPVDVLPKQDMNGHAMLRFAQKPCFHFVRSPTTHVQMINLKT